MKWLIIFVLLTLLGCGQPRNRGYRQNPELYHETITRLYEQVRKEQNYKKYILIDE